MYVCLVMLSQVYCNHCEGTVAFTVVHSEKCTCTLQIQPSESCAPNHPKNCQNFIFATHEEMSW